MSCDGGLRGLVFEWGWDDTVDDLAREALQDAEIAFFDGTCLNRVSLLGFLLEKIRILLDVFGHC